MTTFCPFVEKHRPTKFEDIVLEPLNKKILSNIIEKSFFPNLLFYGPPGTGKTTTIINLINAYNEKLGITGKGLTIHLNASDERGIDIIRNQISSFVSSNPLFSNGMKFIILDEVDYMTKNAQQALRYLLQNYPANVRFCLICNYISKIDDGLQNEFLKLRFNQLPENDIIDFLLKIGREEKLQISKKNIQGIQRLFRSDIRSMINFMQTNQNMITESQYKIITKEIWENVCTKLKSDETIENIINYIHNLSIEFNIDIKNIITDLLNYIIRTYPDVNNSNFLQFVENMIHTQDNTSVWVNYSFFKLRLFMREL